MDTQYFNLSSSLWSNQTEKFLYFPFVAFLYYPLKLWPSLIFFTFCCACWRQNVMASFKDVILTFSLVLFVFKRAKDTIVFIISTPSSDWLLSCFSVQYIRLNFLVAGPWNSTTLELILSVHLIAFNRFLTTNFCSYLLKIYMHWKEVSEEFSCKNNFYD